MQPELTALAGIIGALAIGVVSPGPCFVMVARVAISTSRARGLAASIGMGFGGFAFALAALLGLQAILLAVPALYAVLKILGGLYLCYLGYRIFSGARQELQIGITRGGDQTSWLGSLLLGFTTQVSNPKTAIVYASVFAAFLPGDFSLPFALALLCIVFVIEAGWYSIVAVVLSSPGPRRVYLGYKAWVDRTAGLVMVGLGLNSSPRRTRLRPRPRVPTGPRGRP
jgi:threonine/homoserine/homoserine lactone efflux protein